MNGGLFGTWIAEYTNQTYSNLVIIRQGSEPFFM